MGRRDYNRPQLTTWARRYPKPRCCSAPGPEATALRLRNSRLMSTGPCGASLPATCGTSVRATLQATALVHEAYLELVDIRNVDWQHRAHFFAISAQIMRNILLDR